MENSSFLGELYHIKKTATQGYSFFVYRLGNAQASLALHSARCYLHSASLRAVTSSPRQCLSKLGIALGSSLLHFFKVGVLYVVASVLSTALGSATACAAVRVGLSTALSSVSSVVHVLACSVESIV